MSEAMDTHQLPIMELDPRLYAPTQEEVEFLKSQTKIQDEEELKQHVLAVQREAWAICRAYTQLREFVNRLKISHLPTYQDLLKLGRERQGAIFLDFACCFGNDVRKVIADGYPIENVITSDVEGTFWDLGHRLYKSTPETFPVPFIQGNVFDPLHLAPAPPHYTPPTTPRPVLSMLTSLTPLQGHVSVIHVSAFFHLFNKEEQIKEAHLLASLLSPLPGSMIFGAHTSLPVSGERRLAARGGTAYCISPADWCALWDGEVFEKGSVHVEAEIVQNDPWRGKGFETDTEETRTKVYSMVWCVKRV